MTSTPDAGMVVSDAGTADTGASDTDLGLPDLGPPDMGVEPNICNTLGFARMPFQPNDNATDLNFGEIAGDFSFETFAGTWNLETEWTGCGNYVFLVYLPTNSDFEETLWSSDPWPMVANSQLNTHYFLMTLERDEIDRTNRLVSMKTQIDNMIDAQFTSDQAEHKARFHYVTEFPTEAQGSVALFLRDYLDYAGDPANRADLGDRGQAPPPLPWAFAIDREQQWDPVGSLTQFVGGPPAFNMASFAPMFFDHKAQIRDAQAQETDVQTIEVLTGTVTERIFMQDVAFPAQLDTFDTLEFDVTVTCKERNVFNCSEWDRIANITLCQNMDCSERTELIRWITPYWRRGQRRWVMDASPLLGLINGGTQTLRIAMGPGWERATLRDVRIAARLSNQGKAQRSTGAQFAFGGGNFNAEYNMRDPVSFTPPASATRVELVVILSGHGQETGNNCAEWCDHRHQFTVNSTALEEISHEGTIGSIDGCGPASGSGVPPGQWGNWAPERAYWCPGLPVDPILIDITDQVNLGQENQITYSANFAGAAPAGGNISLSSYIVWYE